MSNVCEWCGLVCARGMRDYYSMILFDEEHKICADCYKQLELIE